MEELDYQKAPADRLQSWNGFVIGVKASIVLVAVGVVLLAAITL